MLAGPHLVVALVFIVGAFAGCIGAESTGEPAGSTGTGPGVAAGPAQFDDTTGGIEGTVTDSELQPIVGAIVGLLPDDSLAGGSFQAITDETGRFALSRVPPGDHVLGASALGFSSANRRVAVEVGVAVQTSVVLEKLAVKEPYHETWINRGAQTGAMVRVTPECIYLSQSVPEQVPNRNLLKTCNGARVCDTGAVCEKHFIDEFAENTTWRSMVAEMDWLPQSGATGRAYWFDVMAPNVSRQAGGSIDQADKHYWMVHQGQAPIQIRIDLPESLVERGIDEADWYSYPEGEGCEQPSCDWFYRTWPSYCDLGSATGSCDSTPVDYGVQQGATFTVYVTGFYIEPAPEGFTGVPDA